MQLVNERSTVHGSSSVVEGAKESGETSPESLTRGSRCYYDGIKALIIRLGKPTTAARLNFSLILGH